jgi:hypothetical protein
MHKPKNKSRSRNEIMLVRILAICVYEYVDCRVDVSKSYDKIAPIKGTVHEIFDPRFYFHHQLQLGP